MDGTRLTFEFASITSDGDQAMARSAQAWLLVDGQRTDWQWSLQLTFDGILGAWGALAPVIPIVDIEVVSEQRALERLSEPRFGPEHAVIPPVAPYVAYEGPETWMPRTEPPALPRSGAAIDWPVEEVEIVAATLVLGTELLADGGQVMVPVYEFADASGGEWTVIAVAESELEFLPAADEGAK